MGKIDLTFKNNPKETSYFIGFFWADGTINSEKYIVVEILEEDAINLEHIFKKVTDFKVSRRERKGRRPQTTFFLKDEDACSLFKKLGKYPKSIEGFDKIMEFIPNEYKIYFLRGLIDGDGCFYSGKINKKWKNNTVHFTIAGRYEQDWRYLCDYIEKICGTKPVIINREHLGASKSSIIRLSNFYAIEKLVDCLYEDKDKIYLDRKFNKINEAIKGHKKNKIISENNKKKFEITYPDGSKIVTNNLKKYAIENGFCYECLSRVSLRSNKYKNLIIKQV